MRREIIISLCLLMALPAAGQVDIDCEPVILQKLDSVVNYVREGQTDTYTPVDVFIYEMDAVELIPVIERMSLPSRTPVNRQVYYYDDNRLNYYILEVWNGSGYINSARTDYFYDENGFRERDLFSGYIEGSWEPYQQHWYNYDEDMTVLTYLRQMMYSPAVWTDFSYKNYIYDCQGRLIERNEQRIADNVIFWVEIFTYDDQDRTATRVRQTLKYFPETRTYALANLNRQVYSYDSYGDLSGYLTDTWTDNEWVLTGKSVYFRSLLLDKEVPVCCKRVTKRVRVRSALRLLKLGGMLGSCECLFPDGRDNKTKYSQHGSISKAEDNKPIVYPNPASSEITILLEERNEKYSDVSIYSNGGSLMRRGVMKEQSLTMDISNLKPGSYYLVLSGSRGQYTTTFIKKQ